MATGDHAKDREIERKYLLCDLPSRVASAPSLEIDQGYLPGKRITERIRRARGADGVKYYRTIKFGAGLDRMEIEEEIDQRFFDTTWPLTAGARVHKRRYLVPEGDVVWEIDEFLDRSGLWLAEVELNHVEHVVPIPDWLAASVTREVTFETGYTNRALAR